MEQAATQSLPNIPTMPMTPPAQTASDAMTFEPSPLTTPEHLPSEPHYDSPLYTEINIPLPFLPGTPVKPSTETSPRSRHRAHTLHSLSPFHHRRRSSSPSAGQEPSQRQEKRIELSMRALSKGAKKRSGTIDAAVVPAVMVLRAELFTPGEGESHKNTGVKMDRLEVMK